MSELDKLKNKVLNGSRGSGQSLRLLVGVFEEKIAELEKKNEQLRLKYLQATDEGTSFAHLKSLEQENAELKEQLNFKTRFVKGEKAIDQLAQAKEHIENLLYYVKQCSCERSNYAEIEKDIKEAENFLKDSEVEK